LIVIGKPEFSVGMKLAGVKKSFVVSSRQEVRKIMASIPEKEIVVVNDSVLEMEPRLEELENLVTIPDDPSRMGSLQDLKKTVKSAIGFEIKVD
jgi:vacuolar-type H+-ATPase subunit F/Vma7